MSDIVLNPGQTEAMEMIRRFRDQDVVRVGRVTGYAGTGKTTLIKEISRVHGTPDVLTPTGKAALRVGEATGVFAMTIHRFLYEPTEDPKTGKPVFKIKDTWDDIMTDARGKLVIIDEASMVDKQVWTDLQTVAGRVGFHILLMGDLFQLPPVYKDAEGRGFSTLTLDTEFGVNLTEVHRQALESPIVRASMMLRSGAPEYEAMETLEAMGASKLVPEMIAGQARGGVTICFTNKRRHDLNARVRKELGFTNGLEAHEPILVTQNNYQLNVWNGEVLEYQGWDRPTRHEDTIAVLDRYTGNALNVHFGVGKIDGQYCVLADESVTGKAEASGVGNWVIRKFARRWYKEEYRTENAPPYLDCNYGYTLTCHKAQGSEWPEVIVVLEDALSALRGVEKKRWLYTAITRAKARVRYCYLGD